MVVGVFVLLLCTGDPEQTDIPLDTSENKYEQQNKRDQREIKVTLQGKSALLPTNHYCTLIDPRINLLETHPYLEVYLHPL
jgi:hypothetical protein